MSQKPPRDNVPGRGKRESTPLGRSLFVGLRAIDPLLQRSILLSAPLTTLLPKLNLSARTPPSNSPIISSTGLGPIQSVLWFMSIGSAAKQIFHITCISNEPVYPQMGIMVPIFNTIFNAANNLIFTASPPAQFFPYQLYVGATMYTIGILLETVSEVQRKVFKDKPENRGKAFGGGAFSLARHVNYGAYTMWRGGFALAAGGPIWGALVTAFFTYDFVTRGVPVLDDYCSRRYGQQWEKIKERVPYKLLPWIY